MFPLQCNEQAEVDAEHLISCSHLCNYKFPTIFNIKNELLKEEHNSNYDIISKIVNDTSPNITKELSIFWRDYSQNDERYEIISTCGLQMMLKRKS